MHSAPFALPAQLAICAGVAQRSEPMSVQTVPSGQKKPPQSVTLGCRHPALPSAINVSVQRIAS
jgi:hypothetical protein